MQTASTASTDADQAISKAKGKGKDKPLGRVDSEGQEAVIKMGPVRDSIMELVNLYTEAGEAGDRLNDAIKATAEKSGLLAAVVRKFVVARAGEKYAEEARKVEQLSLIFEIGE